MTDVPQILLLDDGELDEVVSVLENLELSFTRLRGGEIPEELAPPSELLIATPRRAGRVRRGSPPGTRAGRPVRTIAVEEDSTAMRRMLRRMGFHMLVRLPSQPAIWRLLIRRAIYQGDERRLAHRVAVGSDVSIGDRHDWQGSRLIDISNRGCRLASEHPLEVGRALTIELPEKTTDAEALCLCGEIVRVAQGSDETGSPTHTAAMVFDSSLSELQRSRLGAVINKWSMGPSSISAARPGGAPELPPCVSDAIPGLTLDDETDPAIQVGEQVAVQLEPHTAGDRESDRRNHSRGAFLAPVVAIGDDAHRVLMGRDLSAGGMRVERLPGLEVGSRLRLALHGTNRSEPFLVDAKVVRDDGEEGFAMAFERVDAGLAESLEKLVACLPDIESLEEGEARGLGAVISEILDDEPGLG